ncbi:MAG: DNA-directed RNA polymerase subunit D [Methanosphaera sp.]|uniref:DNA-directed RNA polymerase subunit D n=1 Tax=Methanosphaera sp. BMS TaxID=1789762 RepID=UPI000DC1C600|nr:DNA-directed RNA polymerase subunit D [Methanosphaera sp. BMS]AWX31889.1 DNA-directed RNA polymerase subunit D [Methanosphaera sp. BMS]MBQ6443307.1 DNA-directed RNA polymerase subunit D [Methanosphaera sp.]
MNIEIVEKDNEKAVFIIDGVDDTFINTIRRICLVEIPTLAIEDVNIFKNDAKMFDEVLAHRLGLIPLTTDLESYVMPSECDCESGCSSCKVSFLLKEKGPKIVYSKDLKSDDPAVQPVYDTIPIVKLQENEEVELEAIAELGLGSEHAKWQATTTCGYRYYPKIEIDNEKCNDLESYVEECPRGVLQVEDDELVAKNEFNCSTCRTCQRLSEKDDNAIVVDFVEGKYVFNMETDGSLTPETILTIACDILSEKADKLINFVMNEEE